ncbi:hypothetical protein Nepgr_009192 [Nepenthes gracilis]|uniref:Strictosidine synthase conserved region domain-containing protein n=1 Tax=Nepenthes gracilis TaxID=150966 RepID=A0AAD3SAZ6_NEPGR|nr:hypothetical protein Nepgr_009192 [Nepenthes gracilis]
MQPVTPATIFTGIFLVVALYCGIDPFDHSPLYGFPDFVSYKVDVPDWSLVPNTEDAHNLLQKSEIKFLNQVQGPESVTFDPLGRGPYTGVADGRILFWDGQSWKDFAYTSGNRSELCDPKPIPASYLKNEHICGRPLGLRFDKKTGDLFIADAYLGLMKAECPFDSRNDLDIDEEGNVYFTDSSTKYQRRNFMQLVWSGEPSGRLLKYDPVTKETIVLVAGIQFPNGVSISKDGSFLVFCEGPVGSLRRLWLKGKKAGTTELFAILPGHPDNVRTNGKGEFWVAMHCRRNMYSYLLSRYPNLRQFILKLPIPAIYQYKAFIGGRFHAMVAKYSAEGELLRVLEDRQGKVVRAVSEVDEHEGKLWMGSVLMPFVAVYDLAAA